MNDKHILVIEDNSVLCEMIQRRLKRRDYRTDSAHNGPNGLATAKMLLPDLILLDMSLPGMNGWTVAKNLRLQAETASIPIIALTAHAMQGDRERALEAGCDDFETKPVDFNRLLEKMQRLIEAHDKAAGSD